MPYEPFHERFPELAEKEIRTITTSGHPYLPDDEYALIEAYCNEPNCDCRRVFFNVGARRAGKILAVIAYGWESKRYYAKWFGHNPPRGILEELQGPALNSASPQSDLAPALLQVVKYVLQDRDYVNRLKRHYQMFKETVDAEIIDHAEEFQLASTSKLSRNDPCPCGGRKKYKNCCGKKAK
jgi:hypothetical protein